MTHIKEWESHKVKSRHNHVLPEVIDSLRLLNVYFTFYVFHSCSKFI